ncbi:FUSC family protein [Dictyobacter formicarum]|uniref:Membrane protein n=1 Tax=Dictyobacter formicarum TaxID=2778368 RepID=A0ABQ3VMT1_9CHLR|nr:FUSC family protein [Dictyobacter formicarum]GHO87530.1 membrane protein [Dictyobacter formicarum]
MKVDRLSLFVIDRPALLRGIRITASATVPLIVGQQLGQPALALIAALGGLFVAISDTDGFFRIQILSLIATTVGISTAAFIGTIAGNVPWLAILLALAASFVVGLAGAFGNTVSRASFPVLITLLVMLSRPDNVSSALIRSEAMLPGACWAIALSLLLALIQPLPPRENAVVTYYRSIQAFLKKAGEVILLRQDEPGEWEKAAQNERAAALEAHLAAHTTPGSRLSPLVYSSAQDQHLFALTLLADRLFDTAIVLLEDIEKVDTITYDEHIQISIRQALHSFLHSLEECIQLIENKQTVEQVQNTRQLQQAIDPLRQQVAAKQQKTDEQLLMNHADPFQLQHIMQDFEQVQEILQEIITIEQQPLESSEDERDTALLREFSQLSMASIIQRIQDNLNPHSSIFRHSLRLSLATTLAVALYELFHLPYGYWITITVAVVLRPQYGATQQRVFRGIAATVAGGIIAALLIASVHNMLVLYLLLIVSGIISYSHFPNYFGRFYLFLTPFILLLFDMLYPGTWQTAFIRILDTLIGGALAYLVYTLLWPRGTRVYVSDLLANLILANRDCLHRVVTNVLEHHVDIKKLQQAREHVKSKYAALISAYQQLQDEPEKVRGNLTLIGNMMSYNQYFYDNVTSLANELQRLSDRSCITDLRSIAQEIENLLTIVANAVHSEQQLPQPVSQHEIIQRLQAELARFQPEQPTGVANNQNDTRSSGRKVCQVAVYTYLKPLTDTAIRMYAALVER